MSWRRDLAFKLSNLCDLDEALPHPDLIALLRGHLFRIRWEKGWSQSWHDIEAKGAPKAHMNPASPRELYILACAHGNAASVLLEPAQRNVLAPRLLLRAASSSMMLDKMADTA